MSEMSVVGCERKNTLRQRCRATVAGVLYATVVATTLVFPNSAHAQAKTRIAVTAFENKVKTPLPDASWKIGEGLAVGITAGNCA